MRQSLFLLLFLISIYFGNTQNISRVESRQSLYIELYHGNQYLGCTTGFLIQNGMKSYLVTSYHALSNRNPQTKKSVNPFQPAPDRIAIFHNASDEGKYFVKYESLYTKNKQKRWIENRAKVRKKNVLADVVELPLTDTTGIKMLIVDYKDTVRYSYSNALSIAAFPMAVKALHTQSPPTPGLVNSDIPLSDSSILAMWLSEEKLSEMSGSPIFVSNNTSLGKTYNPLITSHTSQLVGMYAKMPELPSNFIESSFIGKSFYNLITVKKLLKKGLHKKKKFGKKYEKTGGKKTQKNILITP